VFPHISIAILAKAFIIEAVSEPKLREDLLHLGDLSAFVVASQDGQSVSEPDFEGNKESHSFDRIVPSVHIVAHEQVIGLRRTTA
jgi:hypothetical protein